jgi:hypothetical protein
VAYRTNPAKDVRSIVVKAREAAKEVRAATARVSNQ